MNKKIIILLILLIQVVAFSYNDFFLDYNRPDIKWKTITTPHFNIHFPSHIQEQAKRAAAIAEEIYDPITEMYNWKMPGRVDMLVLDDDYSNGWAMAQLNRMAIWIHDMDYDLRGTCNWLHDVVAHEFSHLVSIQKASKLKHNISDIRFGYFDYYNEKNQSSLFTLHSLDIFPIWFAEGLAQIGSKKSGYDDWDSHREMILRTNTLKDNLLSYERMFLFYGYGTDYERGPYNQGFSLTMYIEDQYGKDIHKRISKASSKLTNPSFRQVIKDELGIYPDSLYKNWIKHIKSKYKKQKQDLGDLVEGKNLIDFKTDYKGSKNTFPRWSKDDNELYFVSDMLSLKTSNRSRHILGYSFADSIKENKKRIFLKSPMAFNMPYCMSKNDSAIIKSTPSPNGRTGENFNDIVEIDLKKKSFLESLYPFEKENGKRFYKGSRKISHKAHAFSPDISPDGKSIVYVGKDEDRNFLVLTDKSPAAKIKNFQFLKGMLLEEVSTKRINKTQKVIFKPINKDSSFVIYTPRFSPDGKNIIFSYFDGSSRDIGLVDLDGNFTPIITHKSDDRDPVFSKDGQTIIFSSDISGIFNLYKIKIGDSTSTKITNVLSGAFQPELSHSESKIAYSYFDTSGYVIKIIENNSIIDTVVFTSSNTTPLIKAIAKNKIHKYKKIKDTGLDDYMSAVKPYSTFPKNVLISPMIVGEELVAEDGDIDSKSGRLAYKFGSVFWFSDALEKNSIFIMGLVELKKEMELFGNHGGGNFWMNPAYDTDFYFVWENKSFKPTLIFESMNFSIHQSDTVFSPWANSGNGAWEASNYSILVNRFYLGSRWQGFSPNYKFHVGLQYSFDKAKLYDLLKDDHPAILDLEYTFLTEFAPLLAYTYLTTDNKYRESYIDTRGTYLKLNSNYYMDKLLKDGNSFSETFTFDATGKLVPKTENSNHIRLTLDYKHARAMPYFSNLTIGAEARVSVADRPTSNFFYPGIFMKSMPFLKDRINMNFLGRNMARFEAYTRFPILKRKSWTLGPIMFEHLFGMLYFETAASAGIDPSIDGRANLDSYNTENREFESYQTRDNTKEGRPRKYLPDNDSLKIWIDDYNNSFPETPYLDREINTIYSALEDDSTTGIFNNAKQLLGADFRSGFGIELRAQNQLFTQFPLMITLRYSQSMDNLSVKDSFKNYFTKKPWNNSGAMFYFNLGFAFDSWDLIDSPGYSKPKNRGIRTGLR